MRVSRAILLGLTLVGAGLSAACSPYQADTGLVRRIEAGEYGDARLRAYSTASEAPRDDLLAQLKSLQLALAEGLPAPESAGAVDAALREQGVNRQRNSALLFSGEKLARVWKGEPFEQAMAYHYLAVLDAVEGDWGNARASAASSLFQIADYSVAVPELSGDDPYRDKMKLLEASEGGTVEGERVVSDFELGYAMQAIAARAIGQPEEARDLVRDLRSLAPRLTELGEQIEHGRYTVVLVVEAGIGPEKVALGEAGAIASWEARWHSDDAPLAVRAGGVESRFPVVTDVNRLARDVRWQHLEDLRKAKAAVGNALIIGGGAVAVGSDNQGAQIAGAAAALAGMLLKSTARADVRHAETLPQRVYIALLDLPEGSTSRVELMIEGAPATTIVLPAVPVGTHLEPKAGYVRLPTQPTDWATTGRVLYRSDAHASPAGWGSPLDEMPYILGGRDVRTPTRGVYADYLAAGLPRDVTYQGLLDLYKDEGIVIPDGSRRDLPPGRHILERGHLLYTPDAASAGFARLFDREHPPYQPKTKTVRALTERVRRELEGSLP